MALKEWFPRGKSLARHNLERALDALPFALTGEVGVNAGSKEARYAALLECALVINLDLFRQEGVTIQGDVHRFPLRAQCVDVVLLTEVLEHLRRPWSAIEECHRVLKPGGVLVLSTRLMYPFHADPDDYYRFTDHGLQQLLQPS